MPTFKMKTMKKIILLGSVLLIFAGCGKINDNSTGTNKNKQGTYELAIEGYLNMQLKIQGSCTAVQATYNDITDQGAAATKTLTILGQDDKYRQIQISLYFNSLPLDGVFHLGGENETSMYGGHAQFSQDVSNASGIIYVTDEKNTGTCTITEYNRASQTISGTFIFSGQGTQAGGANLSGVTAQFSGTFSDVPINDETDPNNPKGVCFGTVGAQLGTGGGGGGGQTSTITFVNPAFTPIDITFNGQTKTAPVGGNAIFTGTANTAGTGTASTSGKTSSGTQVGLLLTWNSFTVSFPTAGTNLNSPLNVGGEYFFLKMSNISALTIQKVYVNYNTVSQTLDNISIPNNGITYNIGYYKAYSNSSVRAESGSSDWTWITLNLTTTKNQTRTVQAQ
jgi:hypothetical protein